MKKGWKKEMFCRENQFDLLTNLDNEKAKFRIV